MPIPATREELCSDLKATIAEVMEIEPSELLGSTRFVEDLGMESLRGLEVMIALEDRYGVKLKEEDYKSLSCLDKVIELIESKRTSA